MEHLSYSESDTVDIAAALAQRLRPRDVVCLYGTLGMGKSVFARGLIRALIGDVHAHVPSPTFTLLQMYEAPICSIYHYDFYRIEDAEEVFELDWEDALSEGITLIEWPERLGGYLPQTRLDITLSNVENDPNARKILIETIS